MRGFTLIELMVTIAIISTLLLVLVPQIENFRTSQNLKNTASELQSNLKKKQNEAVSGVKCNDVTPAASWSLKFPNANSYQLESTCNEQIIPPTPTPTPSILTTYSLPPGVSVSGFKKDNDSIPCPADSQVRISFKNISGAINFDDSADCLLKNAQKITIILLLDSDHSKQAEVVVDKGGTIDISK